MEAVKRKILCVNGAHLVLVWNERWLPLETAYPRVLDDLRQRGVKTAQVMMLQGGAGGGNLRRLMRTTAGTAAEEHVDTLFLLVNPERIKLWMALGFKNTGWGVREWDFADYAPVAPLEFDVSNWIPF